MACSDELGGNSWHEGLYKLPWSDLFPQEVRVRVLAWFVSGLVVGGVVAALVFTTPWLVPATASGVTLFGLSSLVWQGALIGSATLTPCAVFGMLRCFAQRGFQFEKSKRFTWGGALWHGLNMLLSAVLLGCLVASIVAFVPGAPGFLGFFHVGSVALSALTGVSAPVGAIVMMQVAGHWIQNGMAERRPIGSNSDFSRIRPVTRMPGKASGPFAQPLMPGSGLRQRFRWSSVSSTCSDGPSTPTPGIEF